jgi:hypothetical protein
MRDRLRFIIVRFFWCQFLIAPTTVFAQSIHPSYTSVQLQLPPSWVIYFPGELSEDGRAGGYIRVQQHSLELPSDVATIWTADGQYHFLSAALGYFQAGIIEFDPLGRALGGARYRSL